MPDHALSYSAPERLLHRLALGNELIPDVAFDLERALFGECPMPEGAVYVTGLARAGSTTLLNALHATGQFASLTYHDMPFVLAPNLWRAVSRIHPRRGAAKERAHADGIQHNPKSPEALEEVFWRKTCGADYIRQSHLRAHTVSPDHVPQLLRYQSLVCRRYGRSRYLAKNNNHILRLKTLAPLMPTAKFVALFREPLAQSGSLLRQHQHFATSDAFTRNYMTWLVHHEFGATHRPFRFAAENIDTAATSGLNYWLARWTDAYSYLLGVFEADHPNVVPVHYERLCQDVGYAERLFDWLDCSPSRDTPFVNANRAATTFNLPQFASAQAIYQRLIELAEARLPSASSISR